MPQQWMRASLVVDQLPDAIGEANQHLCVGLDVVFVAEDQLSAELARKTTAFFSTDCSRPGP